jgi:hypothetical protein
MVQVNEGIYPRKKMAFDSFRVRRRNPNLFIKGRKCTDICIELPGL